MAEQRELIQFLASTSLFSGLSDDALSALADRLEVVSIPGGETLISQGDAGDAVYVVRIGRLRAFVSIGDGERAVGEAGPGGISGEMSLLTDEPRSATVRAVRDSVLLKLSRDDFLDLVSHHPDTLLEVTRTVVNRLRQSQKATPVAPAVETIALLPASPEVDVALVASGIANALANSQEVVTVDRERVDGSFGPTAADAEVGSSEYEAVGRWLHTFEEQRNLVLYLMDSETSSWSDRCARQADVILIVANSSGDPVPGALERSIVSGRHHARTELVLMHDPETMRPSGSAKWIEQRIVGRHHHVKYGSTEHFDRLGRLLTGRGVGLVLSGGGARGFAHAGVIKALVEDGIPIDVVGGTSAGSVTAAGIAMGMTPEQVAAANQGVFAKMVDYTFPVASLSSGSNLVEAAQTSVGVDTRIEDLWLSFFCVAADLSTGDIRVFDDGPLWRALRASISIPGVFPPVLADDGHVLVDGGILDNLPVDVMRSRLDGFTIGIDLRSAGGLSAPDLNADGIVSGWKVARRKWLPFSESMQIPGIVETLLRATEISSNQSLVEADYMFRPPVENFAVLDMSAAQELMEAGYQYAREMLDQNPIKL